MGPVRRAVIDVGTNSVKLLVADVAGRDVRPIWERSRQTRLGRGFYETRRLQPAAIAATAMAVARFAAVAREQGAASIRIIATSAAREAANAPELTSALERAAGLKAEIISGEQEADWVFQGVTTDPQLAQRPLLLLEVGGGSTEFIVGQGRRASFQQSVPLGTVRLLERTPHSDPPRPDELAACRHWVRDFLRKEVQPALEAACGLRSAECGVRCGERSGARAGATPSLLASATTELTKGMTLVGAGGSASILGCMEAKLASFDRQRLEATRLSFARLHWHVEHLWRLPLEQRKQVVGLPRNRADVILTGVAIYEAVMDQFGFAELRLSTRGLRFGAMIAGV